MVCYVSDSPVIISRFFTVILARKGEDLMRSGTGAFFNVTLAKRSAGESLMRFCTDACR